MNQTEKKDDEIAWYVGVAMSCLILFSFIVLTLAASAFLSGCATERPDPRPIDKEMEEFRLQMRTGGL